MAKNRLVTLPGHFAHPVRVDSVEEIGPGFFLLKVRDSSGHPDETQVTGEELESALAAQGPVAAQADARDLFRWVEGHRIKLSFAHDPSPARLRGRNPRNRHTAGPWIRSAGSS
jgi:hypothetical protein